MNKIIELLHQPSTWRGFIAVAVALGVSLTPDQSAAIISAGVALAGLVEVFRDEKK